MSKEPTRHQLSSRLAYNAKTPAFLQRLQNRVTGVSGDSDEDDEYGYDGSGRPPIPKRPTIPERPDDDPGSAQEDDGDEKPQVVVLKEGKHLSEREVENEKRKAKGLPPLAESERTEGEMPKPAGKSTSAEKQTHNQGLSFSSSGSTNKAKLKRKAVVDSRDDGTDDDKTVKNTKKKPKKAQKKLLSFGDGDEA